MIKKFIVALVCFCRSLLKKTSPYSYYGIGDVRFKGTVENRSMAG
jgi:hypothetical protein